MQKNSDEYFQYIKYGFLALMKSLKFEQMGKNCFEPSKALKFPQYKLEMWPGFDARLNLKEAGIFLNIEPCHKVVRQETALDVIKQILGFCESRGVDFKKEIQKELEKKTVVTRYNNKSYQVTSVDFEMSPKSKF